MSIKKIIETKRIFENTGNENSQCLVLGTFSLNIAGREYSCRKGETVLDALLRQNVDIPYACRKQVCHNCLMRTLDVAPPPESQTQIRDTLKKQNYFLACACVPVQNMEIALQEAVTRQVRAEIVEIENLNDSVMSIVMKCEELLDYHAGQTIIFMNHEKRGKNYHISSVSSEKENGIIEIHVPLIKGGYFSEWIHSELKIGDSVSICGPTGYHFYLPNDLQQPLLLIADGFGISPLIGIILDALEAGHIAPIHLFHSTQTATELYLVDDLQELSEYCSNFSYHLSTVTVDKNYATGYANMLALQKFSNLNNYRVFICGQTGFVKQTQRDVYLTGAATKDIFSIFLPH